MCQNTSQPLHRIERMSACGGLRESFLEEGMLELSCESMLFRQTVRRGTLGPRNIQGREAEEKESLVCDFNTTKFLNPSLYFVGGSVKEIVIWSNNGNCMTHIGWPSQGIFKGRGFTICNALEVVELCSFAGYSLPDLKWFR